jgi:hypothetical protein
MINYISYQNYGIESVVKSEIGDLDSCLSVFFLIPCSVSNTILKFFAVKQKGNAYLVKILPERIPKNETI